MRSLAPVSITSTYRLRATSPFFGWAKPVACEVRLAREIERSDAQVYLMRLELSVTKRQLAQALAKCGEACLAAR